VTTSEQIGLIAMRYGVTRLDVLSRNRKRKVVIARQHCYWHFRERGNSYPAIARIMRRKDHTTIMHGCQMHMERNGISGSEQLPKLAGYSEGLV